MLTTQQQNSQNLLSLQNLKLEGKKGRGGVDNLVSNQSPNKSYQANKSVK